MIDLLEERRLVVSADAGSAAEIAIHALAQLPDDVTLETRGESAKLERLDLIAAAYGIADRIDFVPGTGPASGASRIETLGELVERMRVPDDPPASVTASAELLAGQRVAVLTNIPTHYRVALFNELHERLSPAGAAFRVFFLSELPATRPWMRPVALDFEHEFLRGMDVSRDRGRHVVPIDLGRRLNAYSPTLLLSAGFSPAVSGRAAVHAVRRRIPFGIWSGELATRPTARRRFRRSERRWLARRASFAVAYGSRSAEYLRSLRPDLPLVHGRNTTLIPSPGSGPSAPDTLEILVVGRAAPVKALSLAIEAVRRAPDLPCKLTVIGDGPQLPELVELAKGDERIRLVGALPSDETRQAFSDAHVFLFPSRGDVFGLVLVEAMGAGLATVVSSAPGAVADLCASGSNCLVVDGDDPAAWSAALRRLVADPHLRLELGAAAARTIRSRWTIEHAADAMVAGFRLGVLATDWRRG